MNFKKGDKVKVVKTQRGNFITKNSCGYIKEISLNRERNYDDGYCYNILVDYIYVPNSITTPEQKSRDNYNGCYWTIGDRLEKMEINNWKEELQ